MSEEYLVRNAAPTLAGIKAGNLFTCLCESKPAMIRELRELNRRLVPKGVCIIPLRFSEKRVLLYLYRPSLLTADLENSDAARLLQEHGYHDRNTSRCLAELSRRVREEKNFPHEIGLFLSYPPEDVRGFIEQHAGGSKQTGFWKVYGDEQSADRTFRRYQACTEDYCRRSAKGASLESLTAAI